MKVVEVNNLKWTRIKVVARLVSNAKIVEKLNKIRGSRY